MKMEALDFSIIDVNKTLSLKQMKPFFFFNSLSLRKLWKLRPTLLFRLEFELQPNTAQLLGRVVKIPQYLSTKAANLLNIT